MFDRYALHASTLAPTSTGDAAIVGVYSLDRAILSVFVVEVLLDCRVDEVTDVSRAMTIQAGV
jgi:hypothetical protein